SQAAAIESARGVRAADDRGRERLQQPAGNESDNSLTFCALSIGEQFGRKALRLGDPFDLDGNGVNSFLELTQTIVLERRSLGEPLRAHEKQSRGDSDRDQRPYSRDDGRADGGKGDDIRVHRTARG